MKLLILFFFIINISLFSADKFPVMLKVKSSLELSDVIIDTFRGGVEDSLTFHGYILISKEQQEEALKEQARQRNSDCYDDACLVETGKMMAAQMVFIVDINKLENEYVFKARLVDLETGSTKRTVTMIYKESLLNASNLLKFSKKITNKTLNVKDKVVKQIDLKDVIKITIDTNPSKAKVYIDDKFVGISPVVSNIIKGEHQISVKKYGYNTINLKRKLSADHKDVINLSPTIYKIRFESELDKADIYFKGKHIGKTPFSLKLYYKDIGTKVRFEAKNKKDLIYHIKIKDLNKTKVLKLKELDKFSLLINTKPAPTKIYLLGENKEFELNSGEAKKLYSGIYRIKVEGNGYIPKVNTPKYISLDKDKEVTIDLIENYTKIFNFYAVSDVTFASNLSYFSLGVGMELVNSVKGKRKITLLGLSFYRNITDKYIYFNLYSDIKYEILKGFDFGLTMSAVLGESIKTVTGGFLLEYKYLFTNNIYVKAKINSGISYFDEDNTGIMDMIFITSGISIGWNGF